jgi:prepilin-type N-terminal cleavage/methylation domain-containing protein
MKTQTHNQKGFTLVETLVAIFILLLTITTMISLSAGSFLNVRYAKNQITANMLAQEMVEYVRYTRDSAVQKNAEGGFDTWMASIAPCTDIGDWCDINQFKPNTGIPSKDDTITISGAIELADWCKDEPNSPYCVRVAPTYLKPKQLFQYPTGEFIASTEYLSQSGAQGAPTPSAFSRGVRFRKHGTDQIEVIVRIEWKNGSVSKFFEQTIMLAKW